MLGTDQQGLDLPMFTLGDTAVDLDLCTLLGGDGLAVEIEDTMSGLSIEDNKPTPRSKTSAKRGQIIVSLPRIILATDCSTSLKSHTSSLNPPSYTAFLLKLGSIPPGNLSFCCGGGNAHLCSHDISERLVVSLDDLIEKRLFRPMTPVR
jgi:hypothetical protein